MNGHTEWPQEYDDLVQYLKAEVEQLQLVRKRLLEHIQKLEKENTELKAEIRQYKFFYEDQL